MENKVPNSYRWIMLIMCGFGYSATCMTLWMFYSYYDLMQEYFGVTNTEMGYLGLITGLVMIVCWPVGGMVADKISMRKSYLGCMAFTIVVFAVMSASNSFSLYLLIVFLSCFMMGVYYTLFSKIVKGVSTPETEGKNTGYFWALYSVGGTIIGACGSYFVSKMGLAGWRPLMFMFIGCAAIMCVICVIFLKEDKFNDWSVLDTPGESSAFQLKHVGKVLLMPEIWVAGLIYFTMLMITCAGIYAVSMMRTIYMVPLGIVTFIATFRQYIGRVILSPVSGAMIDKLGSSMQVIRILVGITLAGFVLYFVFPVRQEYFWVGIVLVVACTIGYGMQAPCWMTPISEIKVPNAYHGTAIGVYNAIGCISDAFIYILCGNLVDKYGEVQGNRYVFVFIGIMLIICMGLTFLESNMIKKRRDALGRPQVQG